MEFLDGLTYGAASSQGLGPAQASWREKTAASRGRESRSEKKRQGLTDWMEAAA